MKARHQLVDGTFLLSSSWKSRGSVLDEIPLRNFRPLVSMEASATSMEEVETFPWNPVKCFIELRYAVHDKTSMEVVGQIS